MSMAGRQTGQRKAKEQRKRLSVDPNSWHYRLYRYWLSKYGAEFYGKENVPSLKSLDLCRYMRALFFWIPVCFAFAAVAALLTWVFGRVKWPGWLERLGSWLLVATLGCGTIGVCVLLGFSIARHPAHAKHMAVQAAWVVPTAIVGGCLLVAVLYAVSKQYRDFFKLVWAWIVAKKHKVCPLVEVSR